MSKTTGISWAHHSSNFWLGCTHSSPGCLNCYAEIFARNRMGKRGDKEVWGPRAPRPVVKSIWTEAPRWNAAAKEAGERRRIFCDSMSDFFEPRSDLAEARAAGWSLIRSCPDLDWLILTKHAESIESHLPLDWEAGWPHVRLGVSAENQEWADRRLPHLLRIPAAGRFVSCEPLLGPIDISDYLTPTRTIHLRADVEGMLRNREFSHLTGDDGRRLSRREAEDELYRLHREGVKFISAGGCDEFDPESGCPGHANHRLDWVIVGGESGSNRRPMDPAWAVSLQEQCRTARVAFFFKQDNAFLPGQGTMPDGTTPREFPRPVVTA